MLKAIEEINTDIKKDIIIDQIMKSKGVYLLVSNPKVGKSMFALQLANSVLNGNPLFGLKVNASPVLYINTEEDGGQLVERSRLMNLDNKKRSLFVIDRNDNLTINWRDLEYNIKEFAEDEHGKLIIVDMLKDIKFSQEYDINSYQDISQKVIPEVRKYSDKYNVTILLIHHLNKQGKTLGSVGLNASVQGVIELHENKTDRNYLKLTTINRDFASLELDLKRNQDQSLSVCNTEEDEIPFELIQFIKYASKQREFDFICSDIVNSANIMMSPRRFGRLLNKCSKLLESEGVYITNNRSAEGRYYHCKFVEPEQE